MFQTKRKTIIIVTYVLLLIAVLLITVNIVPVLRTTGKYSVAFAWIAAGIIYGILSYLLSRAQKFFIDKAEHKAMQTGETAFISEFIEKLRFCYSLDEFYNLIANLLEQKADCTVMYVDRKKNYVLYNSPNRLSVSSETRHTLELNYSENWNNGYYFMGDNFGIVSDIKESRGFFLVYGGFHLYIFCRYAKLFDKEVFKQFYSEFVRFMDRTETISNLSEISSLSKEWQQLADTQKSYLPPSMPVIDKMSVAAYFRPLVNVSGDYYTVLPISKTKTLLMLGDVSGKGLAAALVMGLVLNTVKIIEDKENLPGVIKAVDKAIKGMKLQDKYTVVFIGIVDTEKMTIRYINASMSDPLIITKAPEGYRIKPLGSNCSLVGIIDLDEIEVTEQRLFRGDVILMASDGVSEVMDESGEELGNTQLYQDTIKSSASKSPKDFIEDVVDLVMYYNGDKKLRDDVTMMVAKIEG